MRKPECVYRIIKAQVWKDQAFWRWSANTRKIGEEQFKKQLETTYPPLLHEAGQILPCHLTEDQPFLLWRFVLI